MNTQLRHIISIGLLFASFMGSSGAWAVDCPDTDYVLITQADVDALGAEDCDKISGFLSVGGSFLSSTITDLDSLSNLATVGGPLFITDNAELTDLDGLDNLDSVGGVLDINNNAALTSIDGLANLTRVEDDLYIYDNGSLINIKGLDNLTSVVGGLYIYDNDALTNIEGLTNLASVGGVLSIKNNAALTNIDGLANLTRVEDALAIQSNTALANLNGLVSLTSVGDFLDIRSNGSLTNIEGLDNLDSVGGDLFIYDNDALTNIEGLANLTSVGGNLYIFGNTALTNCQGLAPVLGWPSGPPDDSVGKAITIDENAGAECDSLGDILNSVSGPSQPVINTATGGNESIALGFALSTTTDTLFPVTSYEATCTGGGESVVNNNASSPITVSGLAGGREYSCTVAPVTNLGAVPLSDAVSATVPVIPSTPQITNTDYGDEEIYLTVSVSNNGGATISRYTATCTDGTTEYTGTSSTSRITVSGLTNGVGYSCSVTATDAAGTSTPSASAPPVMPEYIPTGLPNWLLLEASK